jgi:signal transduction histidine kinase
MAPDVPAVLRLWRPGLWEVAVAAAVVALSLRLLSMAEEAPGFRTADLVAYALTVAGAATIVWARRQPLVALAIAGGCVTALAWRDYQTGEVLPFVVTGLLYMLGSYRARRAAVLGLVMTAVFLALSAMTRPTDLGLWVLVQSVVVFTAAWALGRAARGRRSALLALVSAAEDRTAAERRLAAAERDRDMLTAMKERVRIARELHDVLAHSISVISVQATVGEHLAANDPPAARRALLTIGDVSRESMQELRQMLTLLRDDTGQGSPAETAYEPTRGLTDLEPLVDTYRSAGLPVSTSTSGTARPLSAAADLCAYRIIQEALTNTLKHAGPSAASVGLRYDDEVVRVVISDDGRGAETPQAGHGLIGMRERAALLGGRLDAGPGRHGGFEVTATLPYEAAFAAPVQ